MNRNWNELSHLKAKVVGINNRNLRDLSIDLNRTKELAPRLPEGTMSFRSLGSTTTSRFVILPPMPTAF